MVVNFNITDILASTAKSSSITLPSYKENQIKISFESADEIITEYNGKEPALPFAVSEVFEADIQDCRRLTAVDDGCKAAYEITFDITGSKFAFRPGDTIGIIAHNESREVEAIIDQLDLTSLADVQYTLCNSSKGGKIPVHIPAKSTIRHVLTHCCDIRSVLKKLFLLALSRHTKDKNERKILEYLCSKEGATAYTTHILNKHFCILDLFATFKSCQPPVEILLANLPRLLPRPYSIVNSGLNPNILKMCFSVTELAHNRVGLVTRWLERIINSKNNIEDKLKSLTIDDCNMNTKIPIYLRKNMSGFSPPENLEIPLILIGPGTGVAPYLGFLEERQDLKEKQSGVKLGEVWMFFGCRNPKLDFIYENELNGFLENRIINELITSFSRIENGCSNKYIQDGIMQNGEQVVKLISEGATIFVCGDMKNMAVQVREAFVKCIVKYQKKTEQDAEKLIANMQTGKRYLVDAWS
ncbi:methionine synthase reductase [Ostrinia nubilalis]|uniref:methionine synthase reductase n=1 Tax=Ostrinia nubilalis TaxID=29057 RepID=UPI00308228AF